MRRGAIPENSKPDLIRWIIHYRKIGVWPGWNLARVNKCARLLGITLRELGNSCAVRPDLMNTYVKNEWFPSHAALLFHMREQAWFQAHGLKD